MIHPSKSVVDPDAVLSLLRATHWGAGMTRPTLTRAIANSVCFGVYRGRELIDANWTDVVIAPANRGRGLGLQGLRRVALLTRDAVSLYAQLGFSKGPGSA
jgi:hypothetical protein